MGRACPAMLSSGRTSVLLVVVLLIGPLAGCMDAGEEPVAGTPSSEDACSLGGPPRQAASGEEVFELTDEHLAQHPVLEEVFEQEGHTVSVACDEGTLMLHHLANEGAPVRFSESEVDQGHRLLASHDTVTLQITLSRVA